MARIEQRGYTIRRTSSLYESEPWGGVQGGEFINGVFEIDRRNDPAQLLQDLQAVEADLGRFRPVPLAARTCDLDLLLWADAVLDTPDLKIPHPRISLRKFVLIPLCELIADYLHPELKKTFSELLLACDDPLSVRSLEP